MPNQTSVFSHVSNTLLNNGFDKFCGFSWVRFSGGRKVASGGKKRGEAGIREVLGAFSHHHEDKPLDFAELIFFFL